MKKIVLTYGLISGFIVILVMFIGMSMSSAANLSLGASEFIGYAGMIVALSLIFFAVKSHRDQHLNGKITFGKAFRIGLYISLIVTAFYVTAWMAYSNTDDGKKVMEVYKEQYTEKITNSEMSDVQKENELQTMQEQMALYESSAFIRILFTCMEILPVALLVSLICALILKRKDDNIQTT